MSNAQKTTPAAQWEGGRSTVVMRTTSVCPTDTLTKVKARKFEIIIDEPPSNHGEDLGPQPLEYMLASLAGCTNVILHKICRDRAITILDLEVDVTADLDTRGIFGKENIAVPFPRISLTLRGKTRNTAEDIEVLREELNWRCPVKVIMRESGSNIEESWHIDHI